MRVYRFATGLGLGVASGWRWGQGSPQVAPNSSISLHFALLRQSCSADGQINDSPQCGNVPKQRVQKSILLLHLAPTTFYVFIWSAIGASYSSQFALFNVSAGETEHKIAVYTHTYTLINSRFDLMFISRRSFLVTCRQQLKLRISSLY